MVRVAITEQPTLWNKDAALGALIGTLVFPGLGTAIGALWGGYVGKHSMETEAINGKHVERPTVWNKTALIGGLFGFVAVGLLLSPFIYAPLMAGTLSTSAALAAFGVWSAGTIMGSALGGAKGKEAMCTLWQAANSETTRTKGEDVHLTQSSILDRSMGGAVSASFANRVQQSRPVGTRTR